MSTNARIYYPIHAVGFSAGGAAVNHVNQSYTAAKGVQSVGFNTAFNLEQIFQLGQLELYENIEDRPDIEITIDKAVDGYALVEHLATPSATASSLAGRYNSNSCLMAVAYYDITQENASGIPLSVVVCSGVFVSALSWNIPVQGNITESTTLVCNDKTWYNAPTGIPWTTGTEFNGGESPITAGNAGGVNRREDIIMGSGVAGTVSRWPTEVPGIDSNGHNVEVSGSFNAHIQNVTISTSLNRADLFEQGRKGPYFRYVEFPTEVTCSIEITANELGDGINASSTADNLSNQDIFIVMNQGVSLDLGTKNKLQSVSTDGGSTDGGNVTLTYNYSNFNVLKVIASGDPAGLTS